MIAWIRKEPAAPLVRKFLLDAEAGKLDLFMSALNVGETFYILAKRESLAVAREFLDRLPSLPVRVIVPDRDGIMAAALVKASHAVAYGDSFAIAPALSERASVITGDREIRDSRMVPVDWIGPHLQ